MVESIVKRAWFAPIRSAPWFCGALLVLGWSETLFSAKIPWVWLGPTIYAVAWLPRHGGILSAARRAEYTPDGIELSLGIACALSMIGDLVASTSPGDNDSLFIYPAIGLGLLYLRMVLRSRNDPIAGTLPED